MTLGGRRFLLTLAIVGASVCLALGVSLPIIKLTKFIFFTYEHSLISTVNALIRSGQIFLGITVLIFSIALLILKLSIFCCCPPCPSASCNDWRGS